MQHISISALCTNEVVDVPYSVRKVLGAYGPGVTKFLGEQEITIRVLDFGEEYIQASEELRRLNIQVDNWPTPPAGLFVVSERRAYFRRISQMTIAHELAHAFDLALGGEGYYSSIDRDIQKAFACARRFVTPYAATRIDEYFAEAVRAWLEINDARSPWPAVSQNRLRKADPAMFEIIRSIFARF